MLITDNTENGERDSYCHSHYARVKSRVTESIMRNYSTISIIRAQFCSCNNKRADYSSVRTVKLGDEGWKKGKTWLNETRVGDSGKRLRKRWDNRDFRMCQYSRLPDDRGWSGVCVRQAGELHVCPTQVPVVVIAGYAHLGRIWGMEGRMNEYRSRKKWVKLMGLRAGVCVWGEREMSYTEQLTSSWSSPLWPGSCAIWYSWCLFRCRLAWAPWCTGWPSSLYCWSPSWDSLWNCQRRESPRRSRQRGVHSLTCIAPRRRAECQRPLLQRRPSSRA